MATFNKIPESTFTDCQLEAGVLLKNFTPATGTYTDSDMICATTGGIKISCVPTYTDMGDDVDNCPANIKELKHLDSWECKIEFTSLGMSTSALKLALGSATVGTSDNTKVTPNSSVAGTDFADIWWVGDKGGTNKFVAVCLKNALSTGGLNIQTTKNGKGQLQVVLTGHLTLTDQTTVPMEFYST